MQDDTVTNEHFRSCKLIGCVQQGINHETLSLDWKVKNENFWSLKLMEKFFTFHFSYWKKSVDFRENDWYQGIGSINIDLQTRWKLQNWINLLDVDQWNYQYSNKFAHFCNFHLISRYRIPREKSERGHAGLFFISVEIT